MTRHPESHHTKFQLDRCSLYQVRKETFLADSAQIGPGGCVAILEHTLAPTQPPRKIWARSVQSFASNGRNIFRPIRPTLSFLRSRPNRPTGKNLPRISRSENFLPQTVFQLLHHWKTLLTAPKECRPVRPNRPGWPNYISGGKPSQARMRQVPQVSSQSAQASRRR